MSNTSFKVILWCRMLHSSIETNCNLPPECLEFHDLKKQVYLVPKWVPIVETKTRDKCNPAVPSGRLSLPFWSGRFFPSSYFRSANLLSVHVFEHCHLCTGSFLPSPFLAFFFSLKRVYFCCSETKQKSRMQRKCKIKFNKTIFGDNAKERTFSSVRFMFFIKKGFAVSCKQYLVIYL